jgi:histidyl-tRNA synthetase
MITKPRGTYDVLPEETKKWVKLENYLRKVALLYNYKEIRTPIFEASEVFHRNQDDSSDMVNKETYDFLDRGNRKMTLRPEQTAPIARAYIENKIYGDNNQHKLFYIGPNFRYENPQKGRFRQFSQFGVEALNSGSPYLDAEVIAFAVTIFKGLGLKNVKVKLNSLGDEESRNNYREALKEYFKDSLHTLCSDCQTRYEKNPLRILDCKVDKNKEIMQNVVKIKDYLNEESKNHFNQVLETLDLMEIEYEVDDYLVRGLDYYSHTVFEIEASIEGFGSQNVLGAGGRYDKLVSDLGGPETKSVGFAFGLERLLLALEAEGINQQNDDYVHLYFLTLGDKAKAFSAKYINMFRYNGLICETDYTNKSFKSSFKYSDKVNALYTVIIGEDEVESKVVSLKNNKTKEEVKLNIEEVYSYIVKQFTKNSKCSGCSKGE